MKLCKTCGAPLEKTSFGKWWCPVCFLHEEDYNTEEDIKEKTREYIG